MPFRAWRRTTTSVVAALALSATFAAAAPSAVAAPRKAEPVSLFPTNTLTVPDRGQLTGLRVNLPTGDCGPVVSCGLVERLNQLDGFDLDPRIAIRFSQQVDPAQVAQQITVQAARGGWRTGVDRVVHDPATNTIYAHPAEQLAPGTTYTLKVQGGPVTKAAQATFTTLSAPDGLQDMRKQLDIGGRALSVLGIRPGLRVEGVFPVAGTTVTWLQDTGAAELNRSVQQAIALLPPQSRLVFGSYLAPNWLRPDVTIRQTPTRDLGPLPVSAARLPFVAVLPPGDAPAGGWPTAVFGHGFTSSSAAVFPAAVVNATQGIATIGTNVVGHGFGPRSAWEITSNGGTTTLPSYGRGVDQDDPGTAIGNTEGSSATGAAAAMSSRDALRQTSADVMTLVRSLGGADVDRNGTSDLSGKGVTYFGQSFGGIYGTMVTGADPKVTRSVLNVPGGPVTEIARLSPSFRPLTAAALTAAGLHNGSGGLAPDFREQLPLRGEGPVTADVPGALAIQDYLAKSTWLTRPGSPETFAPLISPERVLVQVAFGDQTVPNPTSYTLVDAGDLWSRTSLYRNDLTPQGARNPHSFLLDLANFPGQAIQGQSQAAAFLRTGQVVDPDGSGPVWDVPIADPARLLPLNF